MAENEIKTEQQEDLASSTIFSTMGQEDRKTKNPGKGKKKAVIISLTALALAVLVGLTVWLVRTAPKSEENSSASQDETITFYQKEKTDIKEIEVTLKGQEPFTIYQKAAGGFTIETLKSFPAQTNRYSAITNAVATLSAQKLVTEKPGNLADYGLAEPASTLKVTFHDGSGYTLLVGDLSSTIDNGLFMKFADDDTIYISSAAIKANATCKLSDYISTTIVESNTSVEETSTETVSFTNITLGGSLREDPIVIEPTPIELTEENTLASAYRIVSPCVSYLNGDIFTNLTDNVFGIYATGIAYIHPTQAQIAECGLDQPRSSLSVTYKGGKYTLSVGKEFGDAVYVMRDGVDLIYEVAKTSLVWLDYQLADLHTSFLYVIYVADLAELEMSADGKTYDFKISHPNSEQPTDVTVTESGKAIDGTLFKTFYQVLITLRADDAADEATGQSPLLTLKLTPTKEADAQPISVRFLPTGSHTCGIEVDGQMAFQTSISYVDNLLENLQKLMRGETIVVDS